MMLCFCLNMYHIGLLRSVCDQQYKDQNHRHYRERMSLPRQLSLYSHHHRHNPTTGKLRIESQLSCLHKLALTITMSTSFHKQGVIIILVKLFPAGAIISLLVFFHLPNCIQIFWKYFQTLCCIVDIHYVLRNWYS